MAPDGITEIIESQTGIILEALPDYIPLLLGRSTQGIKLGVEAHYNIATLCIEEKNRSSDPK
jgi:hypothetical protein